MKKFVKLFACVLALTLVVAFMLNASNIAKPLTQKKVVNPENVLNDDSIVWENYMSKDGIVYERNKDGSWHIYGKTTQSTSCYLTLDPLTLTAGKTYMLSSGMKHSSAKSYFLVLRGSDNNSYVGDLNPNYQTKPANRIYGAFEAKSGVTYMVDFYFPYTGTVIDEVVYPCLAEGTEPGDFYIYK